MPGLGTRGEGARKGERPLAAGVGEAGESVIFAGWGWGRRLVWEGDRVTLSGLWRMVGSVFFLVLVVDPLNGGF